MRLQASQIHSKPKQTDRTIDYIKRFSSITSLDAFKDLGISYLPVVIRDLKRGGLKVYAKTETSKNRYGEKVVHKRYALKKFKDYKLV